MLYEVVLAYIYGAIVLSDTIQMDDGQILDCLFIGVVCKL